MAYFFFILILNFSLVLAASESSEIIRFRQNGSTTSFLIFHVEESKILISEYSLGKDGFQDLVWEKSFSDYKKAKVEFEKITRAGWNEIKGSHLQENFIPIQQPMKVANKMIWKASNTWSWQWEMKYAEWIEHEFTPDFLKRYGIYTDCADLAFTTRWIFSRIYKLPAANSLAGSGTLFTNETVRSSWVDLPTAEEWYNDKLFRTALEYLLVNSYTHTLMRDSYPIEIKLESLIPGTHHLALFETSGHTMVVHHSSNGENNEVPIEVIMSTDPRDIREFPWGPFWVTEQPLENQGGFLKMRWPIYKNGTLNLSHATQMPYYSKQQYTKEFMGEKKSFVEAVLKTTAPNFNLEIVFNKLIDSFKNVLSLRKTIVEQGFEFCKQATCSPGSIDYENYSTPIRDKRIKDLFEQITTFGYLLQESGKLEAQKNWQKALSSEIINIEGVDYKLGHIKYIWENNYYNSDPRISVKERWSLSADGFATSIENALSSSLQEREKKITAQNEACKKPVCRETSDDWKKWNTFDFDNLISDKLHWTINYCIYAPQNECQIVQELFKSRRVQISNVDYSLKEWRDQSLWLNSDPRAKQEVRWGQNRNEIKHQVFENTTNITVHSSGWALVEKIEPAQLGADENLKFYLENLVTHEIKILPGFQQVIRDEKSGFLAGIIVENSSFQMVAMDNLGTPLYRKNFLKSPSLQWLHDKVLQWTIDKKSGFIRIKNSKIEELGEYQSANVSSLSLVGIKDEKGQALLDLKADPIRKLAFNFISNAKDSNIYFSYEDDNFLIGNEWDQGDDSRGPKTVIYDKKTQQAKYLKIKSAQFDWYWPTTRNILLNYHNGGARTSVLAILNDDGTIANETFFGSGLASTNSSREYFAITSPNTTGINESSDIYHFNNGQFKKEPLRDDETKFIGLFNNESKTRLRNGEMRIRDLKTGKIIVEGKNIINLSKSDLKMAQICYQDIVSIFSDCNAVGLVQIDKGSSVPYFTGANLEFTNSWMESQIGSLIRRRVNQFIWLQP